MREEEEVVVFFSKKKEVCHRNDVNSINFHLVVLEAESRRGDPTGVVDHETSSRALSRGERVEEGAADDCVFKCQFDFF